MRKIFTVLCCFFFVPAVFACTTFFINRNGQMVFGRNYDWLTGNGMVCTNQRGLFKTSFPNNDGGTISWTSLYGSISFNQYGKEFPTGGMNEKGLVVELMWLDGSRYPSPDERPSLGVLQWIQYQLDNCMSIEDVIATDKKIRIASKGTSPLHYLVADASGHAATIEFLDGKMVVHTGTGLPFPVLTNDRYDESLRGEIKNSSIDRFTKVCGRLKELQQNDKSVSLVDYSFSVLDEAAQNNTKWSIVYDISNRKIYFKTFRHESTKDLSFSTFDFSCRFPAKAWDLDQEEKGSIDRFMHPITEELNRKIAERSFDESVSQFTVGTEGRQRTWKYPETLICR